MKKKIKAKKKSSKKKVSKKRRKKVTVHPSSTVKAELSPTDAKAYRLAKKLV
jgi:hypothetical protein